MKFACGHDCPIKIGGLVLDAGPYLKYLVTDRLCPDCWRGYSQPQIDPRDIKIEPPLMPPQPITDCACEVWTEGTQSCLRNPEAMDTVAITARKLGFDWKRPTWRADCSRETEGSPQDRAAELANELLRLGIPVRCRDQEIRDLVTAGSFQPRYDYWITLHQGPKHPGYFAIWWRHRDEKLFERAKRIPQSRYDKKSRAILVNPDQVQEIIDFARLENFSFSPGGAALRDQALAAREAAIQVQPQEIGKIAPAPPQRPTLTPQDYEIDDELRDNL